MTRRLSNIPEAVRVGHLLTRARYRQLELAVAGRFDESAVFAARARRIREMAEKMNLSLFPKMEGHHHRMTRTLAYLGDDPVIKLHAAGLKVGELMLRRETSHNNEELVQYL